MKKNVSSETKTLLTSDYISERGKREFWFLTIATFLCSLPRAMFAMLSVILASQNTPNDQIGLILASPILPTLASLLVSGILVATYGPRRVILGGVAIMILSLLSLEWTIHSSLGAAVSLICFGAGFGSYMPAAVIYAKSRLSKRRLVYLFGIFSSMFPIPNLIGPALAEMYLDQFGVSLFFVFAALPVLLGFGITIFLSDSKPETASGVATSYLKLLFSPNLRIPFAGIFTIGLLFGLIPSFMALLLKENRIPVSYFFTSFTTAMLITRFILMRYIHYVRRDLLFIAGVGLESIAYLVLSTEISIMLVVLMGILFGFGHSTAYPTLSIWCSDQFSPQDRGRPIALFNTMFLSGIYLMPLIGGVFIENFGLQRLPAFLSLFGFFFMGVMLVALFKQGDLSKQKTQGTK